MNNNIKPVDSTRPHNIIVENRSKIIISGVLDVLAFEDENVELKTVKGDLTIRGNSLKMESYQSEVGDLVICGNVFALVYVNDSNEKTGFWSRLFK